MNLEKQLLYQVMEEVVMANWIKTANVSTNLYSDNPFGSGFKKIEGIKPPAYEQARLRREEKKKKEVEKQIKQLSKEKERPVRRLLAEVYARNYGADYRLLYTDPGKAADMIVRNMVHPVNKYTLPNPETDNFTPPMPK